ncbi:hypothetical protein KL939_002726 [Ogataea angusta]|nr:hypothetical protein KL939_002726 [Ogataea angusta]
MSIFSEDVLLTRSRSNSESQFKSTRAEKRLGRLFKPPASTSSTPKPGPSSANSSTASIASSVPAAGAKGEPKQLALEDLKYHVGRNLRSMSQSAIPTSQNGGLSASALPRKPSLASQTAGTDGKLTTLREVHGSPGSERLAFSDTMKMAHKVRFVYSEFTGVLRNLGISINTRHPGESSRAAGDAAGGAAEGPAQDRRPPHVSEPHGGVDGHGNDPDGVLLAVLAAGGADGHLQDARPVVRASDAAERRASRPGLGGPAGAPETAHAAAQDQQGAAAKSAARSDDSRSAAPAIRAPPAAQGRHESAGGRAAGLRAECHQQHRVHDRQREAVRHHRLHDTGGTRRVHPAQRRAGQERDQHRAKHTELAYLAGRRPRQPGPAQHRAEGEGAHDVLHELDGADQADPGGAQPDAQRAEARRRPAIAALRGDKPVSEVDHQLPGSHEGRVAGHACAERGAWGAVEPDASHQGADDPSRNKRAQAVGHERHGPAAALVDPVGRQLPERPLGPGRRRPHGPVAAPGGEGGLDAAAGEKSPDERPRARGAAAGDNAARGVHRANRRLGRAAGRLADGRDRQPARVQPVR